MEDPVYLSDASVVKRMLASEARQEMQSYFDNRLQVDFTESDRRELAVWMRDVCQAEECQADIFPLSMQVVDKFLTFVRTKRSQLQLLGAVALLLASKLRQTRQIPAKHLVYYTQDLITLNELRTWELFVLTTLKWDLALITPVDYLDILIKRIKLDDEQLISEIEEHSVRLIHQSSLSYSCSLCPPSMIAWACLMQAIDTWKLNGRQLDFRSRLSLLELRPQHVKLAGQQRAHRPATASLDTPTSELGAGEQAASCWPPLMLLADGQPARV